MVVRLWQLCFVFIIVLSACSKEAYQEDIELGEILRQYDAPATFVLRDGKKPRIANIERASTTMIPASTFEIVTSLVALSNGLIKSVDDIFFYYKGENIRKASWKRNMSLKEALSTSNTYAFQQLTREIGLTQMQLEIQKLRYGNTEIGDVIDKFWLEGPLEISSIRQAEFLMSLAKESLPYTANIQEAVKEMLLLQETTHSKLYGKTGLVTVPGKKAVGWFVGFLQDKDSNQVYSFALNMDMYSTTDKALVQLVHTAKEILQKLDVLRT